MWPSVAVGGAGPLEGGGGVGGRGRGSAPQQRPAWNTDSLLLPGQMPRTWLIGCVLLTIALGWPALASPGGDVCFQPMAGTFAGSSLQY